MKTNLFLFVVFGEYFFKICSGKGMNLGICDDEEILCKCGKTSSEIKVNVKRCSYSHRWKLRCKPCGKLSEEEICRKYEMCEQCHINGGKDCASCPPNRFGTWCENVCTCVNGALCERDGKCSCTDGYEGQNCENRKGCFPPTSLLHPVKALLSPSDMPLTAVYSCPENYVLKGSAVSTCLTNKKWSSQPPICLPVCPLLSAPTNGELKFSSNELVEGATAEVTCNLYHRLRGEKTITCLEGGQWSSNLAVCEKLAFCPDPGKVSNSKRTVSAESTQLGNDFLQNSQLYYNCLHGFEQMGTDSLACLSNGTWSDNLPSCIKVSSIMPGCLTKGSEIVHVIDVPVRVVCPPECADEEFNVWGTSIYRLDSSVCQAAIHSAKITNSGGSVTVINNGEYFPFTGSFSNNIDSESYTEQDKSFRFGPSEVKRKPLKHEGCENGLVKLANICVYISNNFRSKKEAKAVCSNLKLELRLPDNDEDRRNLMEKLNAKNIEFIWDGSEERLNNTTIDIPDNITTFCSAVNIVQFEFNKNVKKCADVSNFVCIQTSKMSVLATCGDLGELENGNIQPVGQIENVFYVGSSVKFSCKPQYYLKGSDVISCLTNGSWSSSKPSCIKVNACENPPVPIGGYVTFLQPLKTPAAQRAAIQIGSPSSLRVSRLPPGLTAKSRTGNLIIEDVQNVSLPKGLHQIGVRAMFHCESRYYKLIGSKTRRCQGKGDWSGRPPNCIPVCGRSDSPRAPFIVNGNATDIGQWPWQAGIARFLTDYDKWFILCGASLLTERWVITAAHCVTYTGTILAHDPNKFQVYLGKYHREDSKDDEYVQVRKVQEIHIHPDYDPGLYDADIALLQLDEPVQLNSRVQPVCLPTEQTTAENLVVGKSGVVTGWGLDENDTYSETLQQAVLPFVLQSVCEKGYEDSELPLTVTENMFCAGYARGRSDACSGDSGGPIVFTDESSRERKWVLEGIVSWGSPQGCGFPNQYGGFTTVSKFLDWIHLFF